MDVVAILSQILRRLPENHEIVTQVLQNPFEEDDETLSYVEFLRHSNPMLRQRVCCFLHLLGKESPKTLETIWNLRVRETLEALVYDSFGYVRNVRLFFVTWN